MRLSDPELTRVLRGFALLLHSGIGAADAAFLLAREEQAHLQQLLNSLGESLDQGRPLSEVLEHSGAFPAYVCAMVRAGEETGCLEETLNSLEEHYEEHSRTLRYIQSALAYPAMVFVLMLLVVGVLLVKVMPVFDGVYGSLGSRLTGPAAGLLYAGQLLETALPAIFGGLLVLALAAASARFCPAVRENLKKAWKRRYGDRGIARKFNNARFARALAMGLASGLTVEASLSLAETLLQDVPGAARRCADCARAMEAGEVFGSAMEQAGLLPPAHCRLLQLGCRCGNADRVMDQIADTMMEEARMALDRAVSAVEPVMVLVSSVLVGLILLSVMLPLADILSVLG